MSIGLYKLHAGGLEGEHAGGRRSVGSVRTAVSGALHVCLEGGLLQGQVVQQLVQPHVVLVQGAAALAGLLCAWKNRKVQCILLVALKGTK